MTSENNSVLDSSVTARELYESAGQRLDLKLVSGEEGLDNPISSPRIQKLGLALAGYVDYLHQGRVQLIGGTEINYLTILSAAQRRRAIEKVFSRQICCIVVTKRLKIPTDLLGNADRYKVPVFQTEALSSTAIEEITSFLEEKLAPTTTIHGVLMEVFGVGVMLLGDSGIGKSECALDLILRGHRLVSDDVIIIKRFGNDRLVGFGPSDFKFHMELRGLGIINIKELFGISALSPRKQINLAIDLVRWRNDEEYDRLGVEERQYSLLDVEVPLVRMPVASGRNLVMLVEVAVRIQMLKSQGYSPSSDFFKRLEARLKGPSSLVDQEWRL
jgi:HPr kinase/phosphorylase